MASKRLLPEGWRIEGLWYEETYTEVNSRTVTDTQIQAADAIVVSYKSRRSGQRHFRTIHGATGKAQIGALIRYTVRQVSPVR